MRRSARWVLLACMAAAAATPARSQPGEARSQAAEAPAATLHALFAAEWDRGLRENPLDAVYFGDHRYDALLPDLRPEAIAANNAADVEALRKLRAIDRAALSPADRLSYDVLAWELEQQIAAHRFRLDLMPLSHRHGIQLFDGILELLTLETVADYENWLARLAAFGTYMDQTMALMQAGIGAGIVHPRLLMERVTRQIAAQVVERPEDSLFWAAFTAMPAGIPAKEQERIRDRGRQLIATVVLPAYRRLQTFFAETYLPAARESVAASALPGGEAFYAQRAAYFTTTTATPETLHALGLREVARIHGEMEEVRKKIGFAGDLPAFFTHLRSDPKYF